MTDDSRYDETIINLPVLVDLNEAALILRTSLAGIRRLVAGGELAAVKVDDSFKINADAIRAFANRGLREQVQAQLRALDLLDRLDNDASLPRL